jgi:hypothetical protein
MARANLLANRDKLLDRLARLRPDTPRRWGKMTAHQMVCHCTDAFRNLLGERPTDPARWVYLHLDHHLRQFGL